MYKGQGVVWCGAVWCGAAWRGVARRGVARRGAVWRGVAWRGAAWRGAAWCGVVWCLCLMHISEPTRLRRNSYAVLGSKKKINYECLVLPEAAKR